MKIEPEKIITCNSNRLKNGIALFISEHRYIFFSHECIADGMLLNLIKRNIKMNAISNHQKRLLIKLGQQLVLLNETGEEV